MNTGEQDYSAHASAQEMLDVASSIEVARKDVKALTARFESMGDDTRAGEHLTATSIYLGTAVTELVAAIEAYAPGTQYQHVLESHGTGEILAGPSVFEGELVLANAGTDTKESSLSLADELVSAFLPPEVDDRLLTSSQVVLTITVAKRDQGNIWAMGHRGPRDLRDIYMLGRAGLRQRGFGDLTLNRIDEYLQGRDPVLPPLPQEGDATWAALLYPTLQEVSARVALGDLCDKVLSAGGIGVDAALDSLRYRLQDDFSIRTEEDRANVERAVQILTSFVEQYKATKRELGAHFSRFKR